MLEPTKAAVLEIKAALDKEGITNQDDALRAASGQAFYNTSRFLLRNLKSRATQQKLKDDFEAYLDGFSPNVQDILNSFAFRYQIPMLCKADALGMPIENQPRNLRHLQGRHAPQGRRRRGGHREHPKGDPVFLRLPRLPRGNQRPI